MRVDFVIVTALEEERDAVLSKLKGWRKLPPTKADVRVYFHAYLPVVYPDGMRAIYSLIVVCLSGMGRVEAVNTAKDAIVRWNPVYVFLVGIAGGFEQNDARLGHVLVPDQIFDYELQKIVDVPRWKWFGWLLGKVSKEIYRPSVHRVDARFIQAAMNYLDKDWLKLISAARPGDGEPMRLIGPMASGDKVIASRSQLKKLLSLCPKLMGLEMEASGAVSACFQAASSPGFVMVRGVSDLTDEKKDTPNCAEWRGYASDVAAAYAIGLLNSGPIPIETAITQFSKNTDRAKKAARIHIPGLPEPIPRDEVDNIDARWLEHVKEENELQSFFKVDDGVSREIERIGSGWGCRLIIDQLDSVVGFPVSTVLTQLATDCSTHEGVEVIVISRRREGHEAKTLTPLLDSGFVELESRNLSETTSATVLAKIGIVSPPP